jgi:hypothetical protein
LVLKLVNASSLFIFFSFLNWLISISSFKFFFHNFLSMRSSKSYIHGHEVCEFTQFNSFFLYILSLFNIELFDNPNMLNFFFVNFLINLFIIFFLHII